MKNHSNTQAINDDRIHSQPHQQPDLLFIGDYLTEIFRDRNVLDMGYQTDYWTSAISQTSASFEKIEIEENHLTKFSNRKYQSDILFNTLNETITEEYSNFYSGLFCGFTFSHLMKRSRKKFIQLLLDRVNQNGPIIFIDTLHKKENGLPISRIDLDDNTYQVKSDAKGNHYELIMNFPNENELASLFQQHVSSFKWIQLKDYWIWECYK